MQSLFNPHSQFLFYAAVMQCNSACQLWCNIEYGLIPSFTRAASVDKNKGGFTFFYNGHNVLHKLKPKMACPGIFVNFWRNNGKNFCLLGEICFTDYGFL